MIFEFTDYKRFIQFKAEENQKVRGYQARLAEAAGCTASYLSQVLKGHQHLTTDQVIGLAEFWHFNELETDFLVNLLTLEKIATTKARSHIKKKLAEIKEAHVDLSKRHGKLQSISDSSATIYYSDWKHAAFHIALTIEEFQSIPALAKRFSLSERETTKIVTELIDLELVKKTSEKLVCTKNEIHLKRDSIFLPLHHHNWRQLAVSESRSKQPDSIHFTSCLSISEEDAGEIRKQLLNFLDSTRNRVLKSKPEDIYCLNFDYFKI